MLSQDSTRLGASPSVQGGRWQPRDFIRRSSLLQLGIQPTCHCQMSEAAIHDVVQEFLGGNSLTDEDDGELLRFVIQGLRSSSVAVAKASVQGLLDLLRSEGNRAVIKASPAASAAKALHFLHPELSSLAGRLCDELEDFIGDPTQRHQENWLTFTYPRQPLESLVLKVKLSEAKEAEVLSSHGWRVWPGAQLLAGFMVSEPDWLVGTKILEVL